MKRERLGYKVGDLLVVKSPEKGIAAKVELNADGTGVASLMNWEDAIKLEMKAIEEEEIPAKKKIIAGMLLFYLALTGLFICFSGVVVGIIVSLYFIAITIMQFYFLLPQIIYSIKHKEEVQYANIFRKAYACHSKGILLNKDNLLSVKPADEGFINKINTNNIGLSLIGIIFTPLMLITPYVNTSIIIVIDVAILLILVWSMKNGKLIELSRKINELLVYRKPTEKQIDMALLGFQFLRIYENMSDLMKWFYWH